MKKLIILLGVLGLCFFGASSSSAFGVGDKAPKFQLETLQGNEVSLAGYSEEQPVLLIFWTTWCPYCRKELPRINELVAEYGPEVAFLGINAGWNDSLGRARSYVEKTDLSYPIAFDHNSKVSKRFMIRGVPTIIILDKEGVIRYQGFSVSDELHATLEQLS